MSIIANGIAVMLTKTGAISILCGVINITGGHPVVDGAVYRDAPFTISEQTGARIVASCDLGSDTGRFEVTIDRDPSRGPRISCTLAGVPDGREVDSFGLHFDSTGGMERFYRSGYNSWDGTSYIQPADLARFASGAPRPVTGYAVTQIVPQDGRGALVMGFDRHDRFQQTFTLEFGSVPPSLEILTWWDRKSIGADRACRGETLCLLQDDDYENGLREWARIVAAASPTPPRMDKTPITGWCSWYDQYGEITEESILEYLDGVSTVAKRENLPMTYFQIDDGFTEEMGDWLETDYDFPNGMKPIIAAIRDAGFVPGLWIAPFMVGNRSRLYAEHPDWVLMDRDTGEPHVQMRMYGERRWFKRSEEYYILDATHPEAFEYLRTVFRTWRRDWGAEYFKTDFMLYGSEWGPQDVVYHTPGKTRIEVWRSVAEMIREELGEDATWLGCGCPLWASVGLVDAIRIGGDVGTSWGGGTSLLQNQQTRNFANHILWQIDPDCVLLRENYHTLSDTEVQSLALFAGMSGGLMMTSDNLAECSPGRIDLWRMLLSREKQSCRYPLLGREPIAYGTSSRGGASASEDPVAVQVRDSDRGHVIHILNMSTDTVERTYALADLGIEGAWHVRDWVSDIAWEGMVETLPVVLGPHESVLLYLAKTPLGKRPSSLDR